MSNFKMSNAYHPLNREWVYPIESLTSDGVRELQRLKAENAKLRDLLQDVAICASGKYCYGCPHQYDGCDRDERLRAEGIEVTRDTLRDFKEPARKTGGAHGRDSR